MKKKRFEQHRAVACGQKKKMKALKKSGKNNSKLIPRHLSSPSCGVVICLGNVYGYEHWKRSPFETKCCNLSQKIVLPEKCNNKQNIDSMCYKRINQEFGRLQIHSRTGTFL